MAFNSVSQAHAVGASVPPVSSIGVRQRQSTRALSASAFRTRAVSGCNAGRTGAVTSRAGARLSPSALKGAFRSSNSSRAGSELRAKRKDDEPEAPVEASEDQKESSNKSSRDRKKDDLLQVNISRRVSAFRVSNFAVRVLHKQFANRVDTLHVNPVTDAGEKWHG